MWSPSVAFGSALPRLDVSCLAKATLYAYVIPIDIWPDHVAAR